MSLAYIPAPAAYLIGVKRVSILFSMILGVATPRTTLPAAAFGCYGHGNGGVLITPRGSRKRGRTEVKNSTPLRPQLS